MGNTETITPKTAEKHSFGAEVSKVLKLMIHSLYTNKDIFLRELISNASDACDKLRYAALTDGALMEGGATLAIRIAVDKTARTITVADSGIGMSREELMQNLGTIARSGTQEFMQQLEAGGKNAAPLIGQFGVGFYSAFMVAERVSVVSTKAGSNESHRWESIGEGEYTLEAVAPDLRGTAITLHLREGEEQYLDSFRLRHIVETYSDHIAFPIYVSEGQGEEAQVNRGSALWARPKAEVTEEQHQEFYRHVAHSPDAPWLTLHQKAEGALEYTTLLYVPSIKPFDLYRPERKSRVKLYIKRVFITDEGVELIPPYLRFLRGVVDSEDLPLNISRETLQASPVLAKIRDSITKRVLSELKKKMNEEGYSTFWANFGPILKEGLCEATSPREQILEVCRFASTHAENEATTSLEDYITRMAEKQECIYTLTGDSVATLRANPQLEGFRARGIEVLLLADHVDDFWLSVVREYKGKPFKSITRADIDLSGIGKTPVEKPELPANAELETQRVIAFFKTVLGDAVADVRATGKLASSPACLAVEEGAMDIRLERFLIEQKQLSAPAAKILEINLEHPIVKSIAARMNANAEEVQDTIWLLLDQARMLEGEAVTDPAAFSRRLNRFMEKSLAA